MQQINPIGWNRPPQPIIRVNIQQHAFRPNVRGCQPGHAARVIQALARTRCSRTAVRSTTHQRPRWQALGQRLGQAGYRIAASQLIFLPDAVLQHRFCHSVLRVGRYLRRVSNQVFRSVEAVDGAREATPGATGAGLIPKPEFFHHPSRKDPRRHAGGTLFRLAANSISPPPFAVRSSKIWRRPVLKTSVCSGMPSRGAAETRPCVFPGRRCPECGRHE